MNETGSELLCGHKYVLGDVGYECERPPHDTDGGSTRFRHASEIDAEFAEGTDRGERGTADLVTWASDGYGEGQDFELAWGTVEDYPNSRQ